MAGQRAFQRGQDGPHGFLGEMEFVARQFARLFLRGGPQSQFAREKRQFLRQRRDGGDELDLRLLVGPGGFDGQRGGLLRI
ncbi:MAG: hypothetical protein WDN28_08860 [Chthoniobacter sp.]